MTRKYNFFFFSGILVFTHLSPSCVFNFFPLIYSARSEKPIFRNKCAYFIHIFVHLLLHAITINENKVNELRMERSKWEFLKGDK